MLTFEEANKTVHKVENEWHYPKLIKHGWTPEDKTGIGFVRSYKYKNPKFPDTVISGVVGVNSDYWSHRKENDWREINGGLWNTLETYLDSLSAT